MSRFNELKNADGGINADNIKKIIPYDEHFLFIDRVISLTSSSIVAEKDVTGKEDFLKGHFVGFPIMPGALTGEGRHFGCEKQYPKPSGEGCACLKDERSKIHGPYTAWGYCKVRAGFDSPG